MPKLQAELEGRKRADIEPILKEIVEVLVQQYQSEIQNDSNA
jgi:hypothetical protein